MLFRKKIKYALAGAFVFTLFYIVLAAVPLTHDFSFQPQWTRRIADAPRIGGGTGLPDGDAAAFMLGRTFGFFTPDGKIVRGEPEDGRFSAGGDAWCVYPQDAAQTEVFHADGSPEMTIGAAGFVHLTDYGAYLFHPGGGAVSRYDDSGRCIWTQEEAAPLTAFSDSPAGAIFGFGNGTLTAVDPEGRVLFSFCPGGSDHPVILGAALSADGKLAACLSGIGPQRFLLIEIRGGQHKITAHRNFPQALRRQAFTGFSKSGGQVFFETAGGLGVFDTQRMHLYEAPAGGRVLNAAEAGKGFFAVLAKSDADRHTLSVFETPARQIASTEFRCRDAFLLSRGGELYLGTDGSISCIRLQIPDRKQNGRGQP